MSFWNDLLDTIDGKAARDAAAAQLAAQLQLSQQQIEQQQQQAALKYNPELAAQRAKIVGYVVLGIVVIVIAVFLWKKYA